MTQTDKGPDCALKMWAAAALVGLLVLVVMLTGGRAFMAALFTGVIVAGLLGVVLTWLFCRPEDRPRAATAHTDDTDIPEAATPPTAPEPTPTPVAEPAAEPAVEPAPSAATPDPVVGQSKPLAGEAELAERKGNWRYEGGDTAKPVATETGAGTRPAALNSARDSGADDLKKIKGVGPKLEILLNDLGFYHFDQIAAWTADEVAWVDQNLKGFKGRVSRDGWVEQATTLAAGQDTAFSKKVDKGGVY